MIALTAAGIAHALGGRKAGSSWLCHCVTQYDPDQSITISQGDDGRVLVHCHAGWDR
jgi:hypothetical protein